MSHSHFSIQRPLWGAVGLLLIWLFPLHAFSQTVPLHFHLQAYDFHSAKYDGDSKIMGKASLVLRVTVQIKNATWLRLHFPQAELGDGSYLFLSSLQDNKSQKLTSKSLLEWQNSSAYFNGDAVEVALYAAEGDKQVSFSIDEVAVGEIGYGPLSPEDLCGADDRVSSNHHAVGRLLNIGCTAWIVSRDVTVSAGHCLSDAGYLNVLEFNVPASLPDGTIQHPGPEDQYAVNASGRIYVNGGVGNDWGTFSVYPNSVTGLMPIDAQNAAFTVVQNLQPNVIRITGYGMDNGTANQTQQSATGPNAGSSATTMRYTTDTNPGNSGSPVIDEATGYAVGVHTHGFCAMYGYNAGTSTFNSAFWSALPHVANVTVDQRLSSGNPVATLGRWNGTSFNPRFNPGQLFQFAFGTTEVLHGDTNISSNEKHHWWLHLSDPDYDVKNHHVFSISSNFPSRLVSRFEPTVANIVVKTDVIDAPGVTGGSVQFRDPWYIDLNDTLYGNNRRNRGMDEAVWRMRTSPFNLGYGNPFPEGPYRGVFMNQGNPPFWNPPYYSVGAPSENAFTVGGQNYTGNFVDWTGDAGQVQYQNASAQQTGVVFKQANASATARYKAHLASTLSDATGLNSQRRLVRQVEYPPKSGAEEMGDAYLVYESAGEVWLTRSPDMEDPWTPEFRVSDGSGDFGRPSIATGPSDELYVIYRKPYGVTSTIYLRERQSGEWLSPVQVNTTLFSGDTSVPVIARTNSRWQVGGPWTKPRLISVWTWGGAMKYRTADWAAQGGWAWNEEQALTGAGYSCPSISSTYLDPTGAQQPYLYITYDNQNTIFLRPFGFNNPDPQEPVPASVSPTCNWAQVSADTRDRDERKVHIVWQALNSEEQGGLQGVMYQSKYGDTWGSAHDYRSLECDFRNPTVTNISCGDIAIAWDDGKYIYTVTGIRGEWFPVEVSSYGVCPNLINSGTTGPLTCARYVSTALDGPPYRLELSEQVLMSRASLAAQGESVPEVYSRRVEAVKLPVESDGKTEKDTLPYLSIELSAVTLKLANGTRLPIDFTPVKDTLRGIAGSRLWEKLGTAATAMPASVDSVYIEGWVRAVSPLSIASTGSDGVRLSLEVVDAGSGQLLRTLGPIKVFRGSSIHRLRVDDRLSALAGRSVIVRPRVEGIAKNRADIAFTLVHVHTLLTDSTRRSQLTATSQTHHRSANGLATEFALAQNYPNPFNPLTIVNYQLPVDNWVTIKVYDVLGREVKTLVDGYSEAGYHEAVLDASDLASGVYLYRMLARSSSGGNAGTYSAVCKFVVMK